MAVLDELMKSSNFKIAIGTKCNAYHFLCICIKRKSTYLLPQVSMDFSQRFDVTTKKEMFNKVVKLSNKKIQVAARQEIFLSLLNIFLVVLSVILKIFYSIYICFSFLLFLLSGSTEH